MAAKRSLTVLHNCDNKKPSDCRKSRWRWLLQTWKFWQFACSKYVLMFSPDGINVDCSRGAKFEGIWVGLGGLKVVKSYSLPIHLFRHFCCRMFRLATMHSVTDGQKTASCQCYYL